MVAHASDKLRTAMRRPAWLALLAAFVAGLSGCSGSEPTTDRASETPRSQTRRSGPVSPIDARVDHVMGTWLCMPVILQGKPGDWKPGPIGAVLEDGRDVGARLVWIAARPDPAEHARWLPPSGAWTVSTALGEGTPGAPPPNGTGFWAIVTRLPIDAAGQGIWIAGSLIDLNWVAPVPGEDEIDLPPALAPVFPEAKGTPGFDALLQPERDSPGRRWRATLAVDGLPLTDPLGSFADESESAPSPTFDALEALASQQEARWAAALSRLHADDPDLCEQLRRALCSIASFESGVKAPVWSDDARETEILLAALLDPKGTGPSRRRATSLYLADQPVATCWVIDDAGRVDASSARGLATMGIANLSDRATLAWASPTHSDVAPALEPLPARQTMVITTSTSRSSVEGVGQVNAHVGRWQTRRTTIASPLRATPPGLRIGPLVNGWTLREWLAGSDPTPATTDADWTTAAILERMPGAAGEWTLYAECRRPRGSPNDADSIRVWLGPFGRPASVVRITRDGTVRDEVRSESGVALVGSIRVTDDRWAFRVTLPVDAAGPDGTLMLGVERITTGGRRWSWPRAMTPWQVEPGRVRVDLRAWEGMGD